jgi:uncharacterized protein (DUF2235 family)
MKRIAIFCDGTWRGANDAYDTNVEILSKALASNGADGVSQASIYQEGVGTGRGPDWISRQIDKLGGGAFGWGVMANVVEAYMQLVAIYDPGDEIYLFGFSRGAFTARSLAGMIRANGVASRQALNRVYEAAERYKSKDIETKPGTDASFEYRHSLNPEVVTEPAENIWRRAMGLPEGVLLQVRYLGVWDTVGALGVPSMFGPLAKLWNRKYEFHDTYLSSSVKSARHAVAVDERRRTFPATLWQNLGRLNEWKTDPERPYQELWFPGNHGSVGGGGPVKGLSALALGWMADGAERAGLTFEMDKLMAAVAEGDEMAPLHNNPKDEGSLGERITGLGYKDRPGPVRFTEVSGVTKERWAASNGGYRPVTLNCVAEEMTPPGSRKTCGCTSKCRRRGGMDGPVI